MSVHTFIYVINTPQARGMVDLDTHFSGSFLILSHINLTPFVEMMSRLFRHDNGKR